MTEPKRWPAVEISEAITTGSPLALPEWFVAGPDFDRLRDERDRLREALRLIAQHARLDLSERGIAEAERYAVIADDALTGSDLLASSTAEKLAEPEPHESERIAEWAAREAEPNPYRSQDQIARDQERTRILALLDSVEAEEAVVNALMAAVDAGADLGSEARAAITALVGLVERGVPNG